jgi:ABC1 atypical kinase-like domain
MKLLIVLVAFSRMSVGGAFSVGSNIRCTRQALVVPPHQHQNDRIGTSIHTALHVSLDDSWDDIAERIAAASATIDLRQIASTTWQELHWNEFFSKEWFSTASKGLREMIIFAGTLPLWMKIDLVILPIVMVFIGTLVHLSQPDENYRNGMEPYRRGYYDPIAAQIYYARHPFLVAQRVLQLLRLSNRFLINIAIDKYITRSEEKNRSQRATELLNLITKLGPTAIKVGQALSVRPDLIPTEYATALSSLQDQVPPFPNQLAKQLLRSELGSERYEVLGIDTKTKRGPIASASIGQVYKGSLGDLEVAVKVQRPNVLAEIALDLYIVREFAPLYQKISGGATDLQALANEWGRGFIAELDYREEAANTMRFNQEMEARQLNAVCAPTVLPEYSTEQILVTEWVDGTRLDQSDAADVPRLCAVALNAYLVMLLELKSLHCDPHPVRSIGCVHVCAMTCFTVNAVLTDVLVPFNSREIFFVPPMVVCAFWISV